MYSDKNDQEVDKPALSAGSQISWVPCPPPSGRFWTKPVLTRFGYCEDTKNYFLFLLKFIYAHLLLLNE
jgi:hypothetical protein